MGVAEKVLWFCGLMLLVGASSCQTIAYYGHLAYGQADLIRRRVPVDDVIKNPEASEETKRKLRLAGQILSFAGEELHLPMEKHYSSYSELGRKYVVWVVYAAPRDSFTAKQWRYPIVGAQSYRGFFSEEKAKALEHELEAQGYDVFMGGVTAYSTLGILRDPLLDTFIKLPERELASLLFHELTHHVVYRRGQTAFNEALAECVAREGVMRWLQKNGSHSELRKFQDDIRLRKTSIDMLNETKRDLQAIYSQSHMPREQMLRRKKQRYEKLRQDILARAKSTKARDYWKKATINNARLVSISTYEELVPAFNRLLNEVCGGELPLFFQTVRNLPKGWPNRVEAVDAAKVTAPASRASRGRRGARIVRNR